ncbi:hypothetical protein VFPPC_09610 [Pochonia chlamydosporia 170]|uniref:Uncharacterized protein n=1 Tax=Pochonia chlamydosporia 170 TaxID=1380566 RepID=A0A179F8S8_METCM|nr:hypothetical protein VFPPC_09610 [Pochonia chlamydosporia 170]OAQ61828.1 hypothetical protein VFPPC_09610 [Pochonia chlamydosporia 170]
MVLLGNLLNLSLGLNPALRLRSDENGALVRAESTVLHGHTARDIPSYAANLKRLHHTVKRARSVIENRDASVTVAQSELQGILTKIEDLEKQVKALMKGGDAPTTATSPVPGLESGPAPTSSKKYGTDSAADQDCDAENLLYDLGARAVVDADGQVSGHPLFRRNADCPMESAVKGKKGGKAGSSGSSEASGETGSPDASEPSTTGPSNKGNIVASPQGSNGEGDAAPPNASNDASGAAKDVPSPLASKEKHMNPSAETPPTVPDDSDAPYSTDDASPNTHKSAGSMDDDSSPQAKQKNVVGGDKGTTVLTISATEVPSDLPKQVVSATEETVEVKTLPFNGKYMTTTITKTTTRRSTVTVTLQHKTDATGNGKFDDDRVVPTGFLTTTKKKPQGAANKDAEATETSENVPSAPSIGSFKKFTNGTVKFSNSTMGNKVHLKSQKIANATIDEKPLNGTLNEKVANVKSAAEKPTKHSVGNSKTHHKTASLTSASSAHRHTTASKAMNTPHLKMVNFTATVSKEKAATSISHHELVKPVNSSAADETSTTQKSFNSTSTSSNRTATATSIREFNKPPEKIQVITVVPMAANESSTWTAPTETPTFVTEKPKPFQIATPANATVPRPFTGFTTVRTPMSKRLLRK